MPDGSDLTVSPATANDVPTILAFIRGLADYEKLTHLLVADEQKLRDTLFGARPFAEVLIARLGGRPAGFALFFHNYSTFLAKPGIYLEDLFVLPELRGRGVGRALLVELARLARARGCGRLEWSVLDWNTPAIRFYERMGATIHLDWQLCRLTEEGIAKLAQPRLDG
jgi:GNAT superfamily N-acetyltransferase